MPEMKAGPELDARLCRLLEKKPRHSRTMSSWDAPARSPGGFWIWQAESSILDWRPIPVSTDWEAMGKAVEMLHHDEFYHIHIENRGWADNRLEWSAEVSWGEFPDEVGTLAYHDTLPHALALAAVEALKDREEKE